MRKWAFLWILLFVSVIFLFRGSPYYTFLVLLVVSLSTLIVTALAKIAVWIRVLTTGALLSWILITYLLWGFRQSSLDPMYLPVVIGILAIYAYSWFKIRRREY